MESLTFVEIIRISAVIPVLLVFSVVCMGVALERWVYFMRYAHVNRRTLDRIRIQLKNGNLREARSESARQRGLVAEAITAQIDAGHLPRNERESLVLYYHQRLQELLGKRLWIFGTLSFICPLIGLLGTVLGVIRAFRDVAASGSGGPSIVALGISEALIATAAGILVAIVAAIIYNFFNIWMKDALTRADLFGQEMIFITTSRSGTR